MSTIAVETARQPAAKTLGQVWGILFLGILFGTGAYRLLAKTLNIWETHPPQFWYDYAIYAVLLLVGIGKGEFLFRRKLITRTLARARDALGETGWSGDYWLAPFCMFSFYRPWSKKHMILSWVIVPVMVGLAILFAKGNFDPTFQGAVDLAIGLALAYAAVIYAVYLVRLLGWWLTGAKPESNPLPEKASVL